MAEDWDLYAVVRGYKSTATTTTAEETPPPTTNTPISSEDTLSCLASLTFKEENDPFSFPNLVNPRTSGFQELHQSFIPFIPTSTTTSTSTTGCGINPNSPFSVFSGSIGQEQQQRHHHPKPHFMPEPSTSASDRFHDQQQQQPQHVQQPQQQHNTAQAQSPRSRKRKCQQKKMVCHVTAENLSSDLWAWRKYGQKPIKGSPYPRNYYRCSSSKGCAARKQVERSTTEPDMFIVTYTGDHTHPRPTHRNSLAGSTRNKPPTIQKSATPGSGPPVNPSNIASSSSPRSPTSLSPPTPLTTPPENEEAPGEPSRETGSSDPEMEMDMASDDEILIPNIAAMAEDIFVGLDQIDSGYGGGDGEGGSSGGNPAGG